MTGIYIHIPFCIQKCAYCDFNSYDGKFELQEQYVKRLIDEMKGREPVVADTVYIGGGTPTALETDTLLSILQAVNSHFSLVANSEITVEANPGTVTPEKLRALRAAGVTRLSLGVQSLQDNELKILGRIHTAQEAVEAFQMARDAGFENLNIDIMYGTPEQTMQSWVDTLQKTIELKPEHISAYSLILEENTPFWSQDLAFPEEDIEREMHQYAIDALEEAGYRHYEISNFAKTGFESRHNLKYWTMEEYLGFGAGAHSFYQGKRTANRPGIEEYIQNEEPCIACVEVMPDEFENDRMMLGFRLMDGVRYGPRQRERIEMLEREGLIETNGDIARLTRRGLDLANQVFMEFV